MRFLRILGWAVFLGASWTWCIGMYLPALLVRDYGVWAFVVFAVPNVVGAAAMAWVLPDAEASKALVEKHRTACEWFSIVTIWFHVFFIVWLPRVALNGQEGHGVYPWLATGLMLVGLLARWQWGAIMLSVAVTVYSAMTASYLYWVPHAAIPFLPPPVAPGFELIGLGLSCVFGLMLCPYLDLTFHQARQATSKSDGRIAFAIGFYGLFAATLLFSLSYSHWALVDDWPYPALFSLSVYFLVQSALKLSLHSWAAISNVRMVQILTIGAMAISVVFGSEYRYEGMGDFEFIYRIFMSFYALFFPAYVWICIFGKKSLRLWLIAVLAAAPMYWMGFIERQMIWLLPGVAVPFFVGLRPISRARPVPSEPSPS
jgi:hypothetical protein